jgi:ATP sulfurylase
MQDSFPKERVNMPVPIVLPITDFTRREIKAASAVALTNAAGVPIAILRSPEVRHARTLGGALQLWARLPEAEPSGLPAPFPTLHTPLIYAHSP